MALLGDGQVRAYQALGFDLVELGSQPLRVGEARKLKVSVLGLPADVREAKEVERLGLTRPRAVLRSAANLPNSISRVLSGGSSKLNFASLPRRWLSNR